MFKKIQDWLFKEDLEELDIDEKEDEVEEFSFDESDLFAARKEEAKKHSFFERIKQEPEEDFEEEIPLKSAPVSEKVKVAPTPTPKITIDIQADDKATSNAKVDTMAQPQRVSLTRKEEFEMAPVISPYFGVKGDKQDVEHVKLNTISHSSKKESFNTVISPFYGEKETKKEIRQTIYHEENNNNLDKVFSGPSVIEDEIPFHDDEDNISLDAIVQTPNTNDDDLIQFSLFGEAKRIQEEEFENENSEENDNEELPF